MHQHHHHHAHGDHSHAHRSGSALANIKIAFVLNFAFAIIEIIGGYLTGSVAIMADAIHDLGDSLSLGLAYGFERAATTKTATQQYSYGYRRLSLLSAIITALVLVVGSIAVLTQAIPRLWDPQQPHTPGMIGLAVLGVAVNGFAAWRVSRGASLNERVISWHLLEDVLGWVVVLISALVMTFVDLPIIDPILCLVFSALILYGVAKTLRHALRLFMQAAPPSLDFAKLERDFRAVSGVKDVHDVHVWSLDGDAHVMTMHAVVSDSVGIADAEEIKRSLKERVRAYGNFHVTIELEAYPEACPDRNCVKL